MARASSGHICLKTDFNPTDVYIMRRSEEPENSNGFEGQGCLGCIAYVLGFIVAIVFTVFLIRLFVS
jgi:hypothetical protein